jgi:hypothetical protein
VISFNPAFTVKHSYPKSPARIAAGFISSKRVFENLLLERIEMYTRDGIFAGL